MISVEDAFDTFRSRLELSKTEQNDASRRQKDVRSCIGAAFDIEDDFLTGSYARHTKTKPLKDVDIFFCLGPDDRHWRDKRPIEVLRKFESVLAKEFGDDETELGRRCVTVEFDKKNPTADDEGKVLSVDAVPAIKVGSDYEIPDRILDRWIKTNPKSHADAAMAKNKALDQKWKPLVKMLKRWNRSAGKPIKPAFLIEVMAIDLIQAPLTSYSEEVQRFFAAARTAIAQEWPDPAGLGPPVSDQMDAAQQGIAVAALRDAEVRASRARRLDANGNTSGALALWGEIMGKYFPTR